MAFFFLRGLKTCLERLSGETHDARPLEGECNPLSVQGKEGRLSLGMVTAVEQT